jgi:hypothetical protein
MGFRAKAGIKLDELHTPPVIFRFPVIAGGMYRQLGPVLVTGAKKAVRDDMVEG